MVVAGLDRCFVSDSDNNHLKLEEDNRSFAADLAEQAFVPPQTILETPWTIVNLMKSLSVTSL